ncbi:hypothetical protein PVAP13_6NG308974 [Panicum virgatum]|uniref:Uncharacterized protein n=1 Tax=Panicum virgatum TaxID=38727 RepID=A0A8T0R2W0_PANVG|nr:hypothetical protein PVAP13_6NG308974 [Panicum virgatum]
MAAAGSHLPLFSLPTPLPLPSLYFNMGSVGSASLGGSPSPECSDGGHFGEQLPRLQVNAILAQAAAPSMTSSGCTISPRLVGCNALCQQPAWPPLPPRFSTKCPALTLEAAQSFTSILCYKRQGSGSSEDDEISHIQGCSFVMLPIFGFRGEIYQKKDIAHVLLSFALMLLWQST